MSILEMEVEMYQEKITQKCLNVPVNKFHGLKLISQTAGQAVIEFVPNANHENTNGCTHGGVIASVLDTVAFLAAIKTLHSGEMIITHDIYVSMLKPISIGSKVVFTGKLIQNGKNVIFLDSEAHVNGKLVASAKVTKTRTKVAKL